MEEIILNLIANKNKEYKVKLDIEDYHYLHSGTEEECRSIYNALECVKLGIEHNYNLVKQNE